MNMRLCLRSDAAWRFTFLETDWHEATREPATLNYSALKDGVPPNMTTTMKTHARKLWLSLSALLVCCAGPGAPVIPKASPGTAESRLRATVKFLSTIGAKTNPEHAGERHIWKNEQLQAASQYIERRFADAGFVVRKQPYECNGVTVWNLIAELPGKHPEIFTIGAHYDSRVGMLTPRTHGPPRPWLQGTPGANDNASGIAVMLELARRLRGSHPAQTIRFVAFTNEEPPFFRTDSMGSLVYVRACKAAGEKLTGAMVFDTVGYYTGEAKSQTYPFPTFGQLPREGTFVAFISNWGSRAMIRKADAAFGAKDRLATVSLPIPAIAWSDDWAFSQEGVPAFCVTDTAHARYQCYHQTCDTAEKLDYGKMAIICDGLVPVISALTPPLPRP
jgi:hypothetical protein